jgi:uncharacterized membrane protein (Fun14 family)
MNFKLEGLAPYLGQITFGGVAGFATGLATKKIGRIALVFAGLIFIALQILAYAKIIAIDWIRLEGFVAPTFKQSTMLSILNLMWHILTNNLPFGAAFIPGFLLGLKRG